MTTGSLADSRTAPPPVFSARRAAVLSTWCIPAAVLALAGIGKVVAPDGVAPRQLLWVTDRVAWATVLRFLGALEIGVGALLAAPRSRTLGRYAAFLLLSVFSAFVAWNSADSAFVKHCGCMGWLAAGGGPLAGVAGALLRNAALLFLVAWGAYLEGPRALSMRTAAAHAGVASGLVFLTLLYLGERVEAEHATRTSAAMALGGARAAEGGWPLPDFAVVDTDGRATTSLRVVKGGDHLLFFSTSCPHCRRIAPRWGELERRLEGKGKRLVLVAIDEAGGSAAEFARASGIGSVPLLVLQDPLDGMRLGIRGVPEMMVVDGDRRVAHQQGVAESPSLAREVASAGSSVEGLESAVWDRVAVAAFGSDARLDGPFESKEGFRVARVVRPGSPKGWLVVAASPGDPSYALELAVGLNDRRTVTAIVPLAEGPLVALSSSSLAAASELRGLALAEAAARATARSKEASLDAPVWTSVAKILRRIERTPLSM